MVIGISIGIAVAPRDGTNMEELLKAADVALYRAKSEGPNVYRFFRARAAPEQHAVKIAGAHH
jgi:diguanylate cyclase (GGDEF)-like protein